MHITLVYFIKINFLGIGEGRNEIVGWDSSYTGNLLLTKEPKDRSNQMELKDAEYTLRGEKFAFSRLLAIFAKVNPREKDWHADSRKFIPREMGQEADSRKSRVFLSTTRVFCQFKSITSAGLDFSATALNITRMSWFDNEIYSCFSSELTASLLYLFVHVQKIAQKSKIAKVYPMRYPLLQFNAKVYFTRNRLRLGFLFFSRNFLPVKYFFWKGTKFWTWCMLNFALPIEHFFAWNMTSAGR